MNDSIASNKKLIALIIVAVVIISTVSILILINYGSPENGITFVEGTLEKDTTWSGLVHVDDTVVIPENVTLTIIPGTWSEFRHYRGYREDTSVS
ncbi:MAG: hypothetical protein ACFFER_08455, partial [Candidatus Thorarchaeota archaeon]